MRVERWTSILPLALSQSCQRDVSANNETTDWISYYNLQTRSSHILLFCSRSYVTPFRHYWFRQTTHPWAGKFATSAFSKELRPAIYCPLCSTQCFQTNYLASFQHVIPQQFWIQSELSTLQSRTGPVQGQNGVFSVYFSHTGKNLFSLQGSQVMKTGFSLWEKVHRENPVFITGMGLQCIEQKSKAPSKWR